MTNKNKSLSGKTRTEEVEAFHLDLDDFFTEGYTGCYPENDIFGKGHSGTCLLQDREAYKKRFMEEMARRFDEQGEIIKVVKETTPSGETIYYPID